MLRDVNLHIRPGERVAFVGATGAGKSSIVNLISRLYEFQQGRITMDGVDIREIRWRSCVPAWVVLQDVFLFSGSLRENIRLHDAAKGDDAIWAPSRRSGPSVWWTGCLRASTTTCVNEAPR